MIEDKTLDNAIREALRFLHAAQALKQARKESDQPPEGRNGYWGGLPRTPKEYAATLRASMDLTHVLDDLRMSR